MANRFLPGSILTNSELRTVTLLPPTLPDIFVPLKNLDGLEEAPMEPGARCRSDCPWVLGPPRKPYLFTTPITPYPLDIPTTSTASPGEKMLAFISVPTFISSPQSLNSRKIR